MRVNSSHPFLAFAMALALVACGQKAEVDMASAEFRHATAPAAAPAAKEMKGASGAEAGLAQPEAPARRYLAVRHDLQIQTEAEAVATAWQQANEACAAAGCLVLGSSMSRDDERQPASAMLEARVPPEKLDAFLQRVTALGHIGQHNKTAEDKTDEVIDTEARIKNMSEFRDNLRKLMGTPGAKLKDLIEVERELVRVQSDLDSLASRRKALASQTDLVHVTMQFIAKPSVLERGMWSPVRDAVLGAGHMLANSVAGLITFVVAVLPWVLAMLVFSTVVRAVWRRKRARTAAKA
jgi:hypothetical protein